MGKGKRKKKKKNQIQEQPQDQTVSRRGFLKGLGILAGLGILFGGGYVVYHLATGDDKWAFLHRKVAWEKYHDIFMNNPDLSCFVPIGEPEYLREHHDDLVIAVQRLTPEIMKRNRQRGWGDKDVSLLVLNQEYGCADEKKEYAKQYKNYLETAISYLYERLPKLPALNLEFTILNAGDDYTKNAKNKAFIGLTPHTRQRVIVTHKKTKEEYSLPFHQSNVGSSVKLNFDSATGEFFYWIFFGAGKSAINAPFSEVIPLAAYKTFKAHSDKVGMWKAIVASELISESLSNILCYEITDKLGITGGKEIADDNIQRAINLKSDRYSGVPKAISWLRKNGMKKGLDLYMENPDKFVKAIDS